MATDIIASRETSFYVTLTKQITHPNGMELLEGDALLIDPSLEPKEGSLVLVGGRVEPWNGQSDVRGVVTSVGRNVD